MSTAAGIAAVTAVLKDLLSNGLIDRDVVDAVGEVTITAQAPDRITLPEASSQLNLYLYLVSRNAGWANVGLPSRDAHGELISAPPLALDLHYLLTAYGVKDLHAELLLGYAMQLMHEMPVLTRPAIRNALSPSLLVDDGGLPAGLRDLFQAGLADQMEQIKICQSFPSTEEISRLWMAFSAPYRPTAAYHVSVVLIESERQGRVAPPVRRVNVDVATLRQPVVDEIRSRPGDETEFVAERPIRSGDDVALLGQRLRGELTEVFVGELEVTEGLDIGDTTITFPVPPALRAGVHAAHVAHLLPIGQPPSPHRAIESNALPLVLTPTLTGVTVTVIAGSGTSDPGPRDGTVSVDVTPPVGRDQRVTLLLNEFGAPPPSVRLALAYRFDAPTLNMPGAPVETATVDIPFRDVLPAIYLARVRIDGAQSMLGADAAGSYDSPQVVIP